MRRFTSISALFLCSLILLTATAAAQRTDADGYPDESTGLWRTSEDSVRYQMMLLELLTAFQAQSDTAVTVAERALAFTREGIAGGDHANIADAVSNYGFLLDAFGETERAVPFYREAVAMRRRMHPGDHPSLAQVLNNMGYILNKTGQPAQAEPLFIEAMEMKRRIYDGDHQEVAIGLNNLAVFYENQGDAAKAGTAYRESLAMYRRLFAPGAPELVTPIVNLAYFETNQGRFREAEELYREAEAIQERQDPDAVTEDRIILKNNLAYLYERLGKLQDAERMMVDVLDEARRFYGGDHPAVGTALNNLASYYQSRSMDAEAEPLYREALEMRRRLYSDPHPEMLLSLNNMGYFHLLRGRYEEAEVLFSEAGAMLESLYPGDHQKRAMHLNNLASLHAEQNRREKAESLYVAALEMVERLYTHPHPEIGRQHNNLGTLYRDQLRREEARAQFAAAVKEYRALDASHAPELAVAVGNLGRMLSELGEPEEGERLLKESLAMKQTLYDEGHRELIAGERIIAQMYARRGAVADALLHFEELVYHLEIAMKQSFGFDSESHQLEYMNNVLKPNLDLLGQFCLRHSDENGEASVLLLQTLLRFKGAVANESARRSAEWSKNRYAAEIRDRLTALREQDAALASRAHDSLLMAERRRIQVTADSLDAGLRKLDREYDKLRARQEAGWTDVRRQLNRDEAIVEFVAVPISEDYALHGDTVVYAAVVLTKSGEPVIIRLAREEQLRIFLESAVLPDGQNYVSDPVLAQELYALVWEPLLPALGGVRTVYLAPDGVLHRLAFPALVVEAGASPRYLDDVYELHFLTSARDLLSRNIRFKPAPYRQPENGILVGDPLFGALETPGNGSRALADVTRGGSWGPLPGTRIEVEGIAALFQSNGINHEIMIGEDAREEKIKALSGKAPRILHIATHGFFFPVPRIGASADKLRLITRGGAQQLRIEDNPMLRAGLVLSGVNEVWTGKSPPLNGDDGILSALEISRLDLTGTALVTLSACETGLGDITNGEGIFGLQRAFQVAGAQRILMSLWKVADEPTALMMQYFYRHWLESDDPYAAMRKAREEIREVYPDPYFWAAFVMIER